MSATSSIAVLLVVFLATGNAVPYSKYGRNCKDIGCRSDETCVMAEDPCDGNQRDSCGRYPTCRRSSGAGESCTTKMCPSGTYCRTDNGVPTCVNTNPSLAFDSAGISAVNGQRTNGQPIVPAIPPAGGSRYADSNPYANANAPPAEDVNHEQGRPSYANPAYPPYPTNNNNNNGYPPYPTSHNNNNNNNGYPPYPTGNNNNGYPPYPTNNNNGYPPYPSHVDPNRPAVDKYGYPIQTPRPSGNFYPQSNVPQNNYGYGSSYYPNTIYRKNGASANGASGIFLAVALVFSALKLAMA